MPIDEAARAIVEEIRAHRRPNPETIYLVDTNERHGRGARRSSAQRAGESLDRVPLTANASHILRSLCSYRRTCQLDWRSCSPSASAACSRRSPCSIGPKATNPEKLKPFECGSEPIGTPRGRYSVRFYQVAILFLVFDIEAAFMYPWAILYNQLSHDAGWRGVSVFGFAEMLVFVAILVVALAYVWRKKAIGWE